MKKNHSFMRVAMAFCLAAILSTASAHAALFNITYDDVGDQVIGTNNIIGTGTFSYDGAASVGTFALSALSNVAFDATILLGVSRTTADLVTDFNFSGISVFDIGGGLLGMVFTGDGGIGHGAFDVEIAPGSFAPGLLLTHEPTDDISSGLGCCGGNGVTNLYALSAVDAFFLGDYSATISAVPEPSTLGLPEPSTLGLLGAGLLGLGFTRRRRAA